MIHTKTNKEILEEFDKYVIGHTEAKKALISLVNRSKTAHYHKYLSPTPTDDIETSNCLLIGGSGTGKTHLVNTLQKLVNFPLIRVDATQLGPSGSSAPIDGVSILKEIVSNAKALAYDSNNSFYHSLTGTIDQTIVFIDEIDKIAKPFDASGNWNNKTQSSLLTLLENSEEFKNVSFILAGAFSDLEVEQEKTVSIGFNREVVIEQSSEITDKDIIKYGLMPELVGRLNSIHVLDVLEYKDMKQILHETILPQKLEQLNRFVYIRENLLTEELEKDMIERALASGQGARSLKREVNNLFADLEFNFEVIEDIKLLPRGGV